jgi:hypothetical protein
MVENKRKPKAILQEMLARGENLTLRDAQNMVQAYKNEVKLEDDDAACLAELSMFTAEDERNLVSVDETSHNETGVISLTSASMSGMASRFGEMLLVDCTHKTNRFVHLVSICCPYAGHHWKWPSGQMNALMCLARGVMSTAQKPLAMSRLRNHMTASKSSSSWSISGNG